jgi:hypothetical protein
MSSREFIFALAFIGAATYAIVTVARLFVDWRSGARRGLNSGALEERLARLESTVEGLSVENQRLIEGHRFFTQLIGSRQASAGAATGPSADGIRGDSVSRVR